MHMQEIRCSRPRPSHLPAILGFRVSPQICRIHRGVVESRRSRVVCFVLRPFSRLACSAWSHSIFRHVVSFHVFTFREQPSYWGALRQYRTRISHTSCLQYMFFVPYGYRRSNLIAVLGSMVAETAKMLQSLSLHRLETSQPLLPIRCCVHRQVLAQRSQ